MYFFQFYKLGSPGSVSAPLPSGGDSQFIAGTSCPHLVEGARKVWDIFYKSANPINELSTIRIQQTPPTASLSSTKLYIGH